MTVVEGGVADGIGVVARAVAAIGVSRISDPVRVVILSLGLWSGDGYTSENQCECSDWSDKSLEGHCV